MHAQTVWHSIHLNESKRLAISKNRVLHHHLLRLGDNILERVYTYKYLGVQITSDLSWSDQMLIISKARKLIGLLYRQFQSDTDPATLFNLYVTLVRPHLQYCTCEVWSPHLQKDMKKLEQVQNFGLRMCTKRWSADYIELLYISIQYCLF